MACLRALSDAERRDVLRSSVLWAFKRYKGSRGEGEGAEGEDAILAAASSSSSTLGDPDSSLVVGGSDGEEGADGVEGAEEEEATTSKEDALHPNALAWKQAGDAYMAALFGQAGKEDRAGGTGKQQQQQQQLVEEGVQAGRAARKLSPSSEVHSWVGGSLEYTSEGVKSEAPKGRKRAAK